jgi:hypothetical protein
MGASGQADDLEEGGMSKRGAGTILLLGLAGFACGGHPEQRILDQYFGAVNAGDNQTLTSFAMVPFNQKVQKWVIVSSSPETRTPATLPDLGAKVKKLEGDIAANKKAAGAYSLEHADEYNRYMEATRKGGKLPAGLQKFGDEWTKFEQTDKDLKKEASETKAAVEKEKRTTVLSVSQVPDVESLSGDVVEKQLELALTMNGEVKNYTMGLRRYDLTASGPGQGRVVSRWIVETLQPK